MADVADLLGVGRVKTVMCSPSQSNQVGTTCGRPSGRVELSQITRAFARRSWTRRIERTSPSGEGGRTARGRSWLLATGSTANIPTALPDLSLDAAIRHALDFQTWHSLTSRGLSDAEARDAMTSFVTLDSVTIYFVEVGGVTLGVYAGHARDLAPPAMLAELDAVVASLRIEP
jgi:hypothetical protein